MTNLERIVRSLHQNFGQDIVAIDMQLVSPLFDTFVIATADNPRLLMAIVDHLQDDMAKVDVFARRVEGDKNSSWIVVDYQDTIVHLFLEDERKNYNLEKLWLDQGRIDIQAYLTDDHEL